MAQAAHQIAAAPEALTAELKRDHFVEIARFIKERAGINLSSAKMDFVFVRLNKRVSALGFTTFKEYLDHVKSPAGAGEVTNLICAVTTNVTNFNREPHHYEHFSSEVMPILKERLSAGQGVRIWSAGCSDGREAYTAACFILEQLPNAYQSDLRILATDIDDNCVATGKKGYYEAEKIEKLPANLRNKYFAKADGGMQAKPELLKLVSFKKLNLMNDWPMSRKFDVIFCRNVLIYFDVELQSTILERFGHVSHPEGFLYIGHSERLSGAAMDMYQQIGTTTFKRI